MQNCYMIQNHALAVYLTSQNWYASYYRIFTLVNKRTKLQTLSLTRRRPLGACINPYQGPDKYVHSIEMVQSCSLHQTWPKQT